MSEFNITTRYARALLELAEEKKIFDDISNDVELVYKAFSVSKELRIVMASPVIHKDKKSEVLKSIFGKINNNVVNFLLFVVQKNRENYMFRILKRFLDLRDIKLGIANAEVTTIYDFGDKQIQKLKNSLEKYTGKKVNINFKKSEELIGGFIVKIDDTVIDASIKHQLKMLKKKFLVDPALLEI